MGQVKVEIWTDEQLRRHADGYLASNHPPGTIPIPIEELIEIKHRIDVIPVEGLMQSGHEAYPARDCGTIYIDLGIYTREDPNRRRFTLAHELAHIRIHKNVFAAADYTSIDGWRAFIAGLSDSDVAAIEKQAYKLAGFLLVPATHLSAEYNKLARTLASQGMDIRALTPGALRRVAQELGKRFQVSSGVIHRRACREGLWAWDDLPA